MGKRAKSIKNPGFRKRPRKDRALIEAMSEFPVWQTGVIDLNGSWGWKKIEGNCFFDKILPKIQNFESMKWPEILGRNSHEININKLCSEAQKRLKHLELDDFENLVSLRLSGPQRVWGIKIGNIFKILWWDPNHEVCPSKLKHT